MRRVLHDTSIPFLWSIPAVRIVGLFLNGVGREDGRSVPFSVCNGKPDSSSPACMPPVADGALVIERCYHF